MPNVNKNYLKNLAKQTIAWVQQAFSGRGEFSIFQTPNALYCVGPIKETKPQIILKIDAKPKSEKLCGSQSANAKVGQNFIHQYELPAKDLRLQRQAILAIWRQTNKTGEELAPALLTEKYEMDITPQIKRQIFIAEMEEKFLKNASEDNPDITNPSSGPYAKLAKYFSTPPQTSFDFELTAEDIKNWNLASLNPDTKTWIKNYKALAPQAIAGIREAQDVKHPWNPHYTTNTLGILLTAQALAEMAAEEQHKNLNELDLVTGGEVRYNTELHVDLVARLWAALGITAHRPKPNKKTTVWGAAFITAIKSWAGGMYFTASHSGRNIFCGKLLSSDGSQFIVEQVVGMVANIEKKLLRVLKTNEPLILHFASGDDKNIRQDIDNPEHPQFIDLTGYYADYLRQGVVTERLISDAQTAQAAGLKVGYSLMHGCMGDNLPALLEKLKLNDIIEYHNFQQDSYFGGIGVDDYNEILWSAQEYAPLKNMVVEYVKKYIKPDNFKDKPVGYSVSGKIDAEKLSAAANIALPNNVAAQITIKFKVDTNYYDNQLLFAQKRMSYLPIPNTDKALIFYAAKFFDLSQDLSWLEVLKTTGFDYVLGDKAVGYIEMTTDPDGDRLVIFQVEKNTGANREFLQNLGVNFIYLNDEKILAAYTPNQSFLMTIAYRKRQLVKSGLWEKYDWLIIMTTLSAASWLEWAASQKDKKFLIKYKDGENWEETPGIPVLSGPVGIKEIAAFQRKIEAKIKKNQETGKAEDILIHDIYGNCLNLGKNPAVLFAGEQSGGMVLGRGELIRSLDGTRGFVAMHDKSAGEASVAFIGLIAELYNQKQIFLSKELAGIYQKHSIVRQNDVLVNNVLYDATAPIQVQQEQKEIGVGARDRNNAFYLSLAFAFSDKIITLSDAKKILQEAFPALNFSDLINIIFVGDGAYFDFKTKFIEIRPSGTDAKIRGGGCGKDKEEMTKFCDLMCKFDPHPLTGEIPLIKLYETKLPTNYRDIAAVLKRKDEEYDKYIKKDA